MPNTKTAKKNFRKTQKKTIVNTTRESQIKTQKKKILKYLDDELKLNTPINDTFLQKIASLIGKLHSKSRKHPKEKLKASKFESKVISKIKEKKKI